MIALLLLLAVAVDAQPVSVYKDGRQTPARYHGAGREEPEPAEVRDVPIGYFGPRRDTFWAGASLAIEQANRSGGYKGKPFRLVQAWSESPWKAGASLVVRMAYVDRVWAMIGSVDGPGTHLAEQVAAKALFPIVDPGSTDRTVNGAGVPWVFSCLPSDSAIAEALGSAVTDKAGEAFVVLSTTDHDSRLLTGELRKYLSRQKITPRLMIEVGPTVPVMPAGVAAVVLLAPPAESARILAALPANLTILGGPGMARRAFVDAAAARAEGTHAPLLTAGSLDLDDYAAAQAFDAVTLLVASIRRAGLNRALIRDALQSAVPWQGGAGEIRWDEFGRNQRRVEMGTIVNGRLRRQPLPVPASTP